MRAVVREVSASFSQALRPDSLQADPCVRRAREAHARYCEALDSIGLSVEVLAPLDAHPDACFVEDRIVSRGGRVLVTTSAAPSRRGEASTLVDYLSRGGHCLQMPSAGPATLDGGDVIQLGDVVLVGLSGRTNRAGLEMLRAWLGDRVRRVIGVPVTSELHLKCRASPLDERTLLCVEGWPHLERLPSDIEVIKVPEADAYAANAVAHGGAVVMAHGYPRAAAAVAATGRTVVIVDCAEFRRAQGSLTCLSAQIDARC